MKTVINQKQKIAHSFKEHEKCAYDVQSKADTTMEENTRLLDQSKMVQKENSDISDDLSNMVDDHSHAEEKEYKSQYYGIRKHYIHLGYEEEKWQRYDRKFWSREQAKTFFWINEKLSTILKIFQVKKLLST